MGLNAKCVLPPGQTVIQHFPTNHPYRPVRPGTGPVTYHRPAGRSHLLSFGSQTCKTDGILLRPLPQMSSAHLIFTGIICSALLSLHCTTLPCVLHCTALHSVLCPLHCNLRPVQCSLCTALHCPVHCTALHTPYLPCRAAGSPGRALPIFAGRRARSSRSSFHRSAAIVVLFSYTRS